MLLFAFQGQAILRQPLVIAMLAVPLTLICMTLYSGLMPQTKIQPNLPG